MKIYILFLILFVFIISCENSFENQFIETENKLVVQGIFNPDSVWYILLSHTLGLLDTSKIQVVENATVLISDEQNKYDTLLYKGEGVYFSPDNKPRINKPYKLFVEKNGYKSITSTSKIPQPIAIDSITYITEFTNDPFYAYMGKGKINIYFQDNANESNYYTVRISDSPDSYSEFITSDPAIVTEAPANLIYPDGLYHGYGAIFSDNLFNGKSYSLNLSFPLLYYPDTTAVQDSTHKVILSSISEDLYKYDKSWEQRKDWLGQHNPFAEPVLIYNNIENGIGIFAGFSKSECERKDWIVK